MAFNNVTFKKSMLTWDAVAKKAPTEIADAVKKLGGDHPEAAQIGAQMTKDVSVYSKKIKDLLDRVVNAKDDKGRVDAAKNAMSAVKQYQNYVASSHLPAEVKTHLSGGLGELVKGLAT